MNELREYLDLKKQYEKLNLIYELLKDQIHENTNQIFQELQGWFLVKIQDMERKANKIQEI